MKQEIMSGDEAVARGAYEAGCNVAVAYPGTPSTEILENIGALYREDIYAHWACNEKVATEIAAGASIGGARSLCAMKHVGMNVAADPIFTIAYAGVNGGMVIITADDPGCHSSQNEQDNRWYAPHAKLAMLEPSDSMECKTFTKAAFELSEQFDTPVLIRLTTRVCHSKSLVCLNERESIATKPYVRDTGKFAMLPSTARKRHVAREAFLKMLEEYGNTCVLNTVEYDTKRDIGIITSGISYQHAKEVFGDSGSYLKLGLTYPLPQKLIAEFATQFKTLYVIEENDPYLETAVRALGFTNCIGKEKITIQGELNAQILRESLLGEAKPKTYVVEEKVPARPPVLCAGCPHRGFFYAVSKQLDKIVPAGDIGCYGLGVNPPLNGYDYSLCMGSGLSSIIGFSKALELQGDKRKALGMVGDSTFFHSGMNSLIDVISTQANVIACILDNSITAMTGHQPNAGNNKNVMGLSSPSIDLVSIIRSLGIAEDHLSIVDPMDLAAMSKALKDGIAAEGPFVIITKHPCALIKEVSRANAGKYCKINPDMCRGCKACMKITCPAIAFSDGKARIFDTESCTGCGLCMQMCKFDAIEKVGE